MRLHSMRRGAVFGAMAALTVAATVQQSLESNRSAPDRPFRIAGNLYYVGATGVTAFLLTGPEGHLLIANGDPEAAPLIIAGIARFGFDVADVRVSLTSHAHSDRAGGLRTSRIEHRYEDSATIRLGPIALTTRVRAGRTRSCRSWSFPDRGGRRELLAVGICGRRLSPYNSRSNALAQ
jgi:metallo-beta-lactamase class B